jgi:hypothetical protein
VDGKPTAGVEPGFGARPMLWQVWGQSLAVLVWRGKHGTLQIWYPFNLCSAMSMLHLRILFCNATTATPSPPACCSSAQNAVCRMVYLTRTIGDTIVWQMQN